MSNLVKNDHSSGQRGRGKMLYGCALARWEEEVVWGFCTVSRTLLGHAKMAFMCYVTVSVWFEQAVMVVHTSVLQAMYCSMYGWI